MNRHCLFSKGHIFTSPDFLMHIGSIVWTQAATELATFCDNLSKHTERDEPVVSFRGGYATVHKVILRADGSELASRWNHYQSKRC